MIRCVCRWQCIHSVSGKGIDTYLLQLQIEEHLAMLQGQYQDSVNQRESLKERKKVAGLRLQRASVLTSALANEKASKMF